MVEQLKSTSWHSYPSIYNLGHKQIVDLFKEDVLIEEKVDGSQISFGVFDGELKVRSKGAIINVDHPEKMFSKAVEWLKRDPIEEGGDGEIHQPMYLNLHPEWTYSGEYLQKPKHNALAYERTPQNNIIIFDIRTGEEEYLDYESKRREAERIGLETVPCLLIGRVNEVEPLLELLKTTSILGSQTIEGFVVKNYRRYGLDKKVLIGKYVSEAFKEVHSAEWKASNPSNADMIQRIVLGLRTPARWQKAVQHLKERGELEGSPRDIGKLIKEAQEDILRECEDEIKEALYNHAKSHIARGSVAGLAEWYKESLMNRQFQG